MFLKQIDIDTPNYVCYIEVTYLPAFNINKMLDNE